MTARQHDRSSTAADAEPVETAAKTISDIAPLTPRGWLWGHAPMLADVGVAFLVSRLVFYLVAVMAMLAIPEYAGDQYAPWHAPAPALIDASWRWDAGWYAAIARDGYHWQGGEGDVAFFPLYPLLIRGTLLVLPVSALYAAGVVINHLVFFLALVAVWYYAESLGGRGVAQRTVFLLSIFPTAFFFNAAYTEALFLLTAASTLALLQRGRFGLAGLAGFFAALTRAPGIYLALPFVIALWQQRAWRGPGWPRRLAPVLLIPAGLGIYMGYLHARFGDPLAFAQVQRAWGHVRMFPLTALYRSVEYAFTESTRTLPYLMNLVNTAAAFFALAVGAVTIRRDLPGGAFALVGVLTALAVPIEGMPSISLARYVVVLFPLFIPLARWARHWPVLVLLTTLFLPAQAILAALFMRWYWVI